MIVSHFYARGKCVDPPPHKLVVRNFQKLDVMKLNEFLMCDDIWDDVLSRFDNISDCVECFNLIINDLLDLLVPLKKLRVRQKDCPWLSSPSLTRARRLRDVVHRKALKSNSASDWSSYRTLRNKVNSILRSAKSLYFNKLLSSLRSNPGKFWRHFQSLSRRSKPVCNIQFSVTADILNTHFLTNPYTTTANVTSAVPATKFVQEFFDNRVIPPLQFDFVDVNTISSLVVDLDVHKAAGADGLSPRLLKASPYMVRLITIWLISV